MKTEKIKDSYSDDVRLALLEQSITNINDTMIRFEKKFDKLDSDIANIHKDLKSDFRWILIIIAGLAAIIAHGFHWF
jgi:hypothetical protein